MKRTVYPGALRGRVNAIPSKSDAHRQLILAALSDGPTTLEMGPGSEDIEATARCLRALDARVENVAEGLRVEPIRRLPEGTVELDCGESGSTLRFLLPLAAALGADARFLARGRLGERPNEALIEALRERGARIDGDKPPMWVRGGDRLSPGPFPIPGNISSQYATGLLMALPLLDGPSEIVLTSPVESRAYINMTVEAMAKYGVAASRTDNGYRIPAPQTYRSPARSPVEGDWSNAAFFLAANALGGEVAVVGLLGNSTQADRAIAGLLEQFKENASRAIDASGCPDLVPILAVIAAYAPGVTRITHAARLRIKESDRLSAISECLHALGARCEELPDGLVIPGGQQLTGGQVCSHNDHRIAMAMAIAATCAAGPVQIDCAEAVNKSYPGFFADFRRLGGRIDG